MLAKFHGNILNLSEAITKSFRGATFFWLTLYVASAAQLAIGHPLSPESPSGTHFHMSSEIQAVVTKLFDNCCQHFCSCSIGVSSALEVYAITHCINLHFSFILLYFMSWVL